MSQFNFDQILDTDLIPCTGDDGVNRTITGFQFKELFGGKITITSDVEWEFGSGNNIVVTKNAEATGGEPPYSLKTEFDITISEEVVEETLARVPVNAQPIAAAETCVLSFGYTNTTGSTSSQDIWGYSANIGGFSQIADPQNAGSSVIWGNDVNNRYGISSIVHNNKQILINPYQGTGTDATRMMFVMTDGQKVKILPWHENKYYGHIDGLHGSGDALIRPVSRFFMDKRGVLCSAVYARGIMKYPDIMWDPAGFPELDNKTMAQAQYIAAAPGGETASGKYFKGAVYDPIADRVYFSNGNDFMSMELNPDAADAYKIRRKRGTTSDNNCSVNIVFTSNYMIRTIIKADGTILNAAAMNKVDEMNQGVESSLLSSTYTYPLFIANLDQSKIFKMLPGQSVKYMNYTDTGSPSDDSSWKEYRSEPISNSGAIGGAGAIVEDPFTLVWYQDGKMQSWGSIPEVDSEAAVIQTITDSSVPPESAVSTVSKNVSRKEA